MSVRVTLACLVSSLAAAAALSAELPPDSRGRKRSLTRVADIPAGKWVRLRAVLTDKTKAAGLSSRSWNKLLYDPASARFYVWEGWNQTHSGPKSGFPYAPRRYHIYSDAVFSFALPNSVKQGKVDLDIEAVSCWNWSSGKKWALRDPARDHPKMKTPSPKDRHPFGSTALDTKRRGLWQFGGVNTGGGVGWPNDFWFYDIRKGEWKEHQAPAGMRVGGASFAVYVTDRDILFVLIPSPSRLTIWEYDIGAAKWTEIKGHRPQYRLEWYARPMVYDPERKRVLFFASLYTGKRDKHGRPELIPRAMSYNPATKKLTVGEPVKSPEGIGHEISLDKKRKRIVCLTRTSPKRGTPMELWYYDSRTNAMVKQKTGGTPPKNVSGMPCLLAWDERNDVYVVWRGGWVYALRPAYPGEKKR